MRVNAGRLRRGGNLMAGLPGLAQREGKIADSTITDLYRQSTEITLPTAQDIARGRSTEIDSLNGYVVRRGAELGVATPVNQPLLALKKLLEA
jgi:ketopantoate reductase